MDDQRDYEEEEANRRLLAEPDPAAGDSWQPAEVDPEQAAELLAMCLTAAMVNDTNYRVRYTDVLRALALAADLGYRAGIKIDPKEPAWPVVYIDLPEVGQVSWHMPEYAGEWDGHSTAEKFARINAFRKRVAP